MVTQDHNLSNIYQGQDHQNWNEFQSIFLSDRYFYLLFFYLFQYVDIILVASSDNIDSILIFYFFIFFDVDDIILAVPSDSIDGILNIFKFLHTRL